MKLEGKIILITGGSSGIGLSAAVKLKGKGSAVIICGRDEKKLQAAKEKHNLYPIKCDVSDENQVVKMFELITKEFNNLDVLINNAGYGYFETIENIKADKFIDVYKTNVLGTALCTREASKIFMKQNYGNIINISSTAGLKGFAGGSPYVATKFALRGLTECLRTELRKYNVRVILINPSEVQTSFSINARGVARDYNETKLIAEDIAHTIVSSLEMEDRGFIPELTVFATNPKD